VSFRLSVARRRSASSFLGRRGTESHLKMFKQHRQRPRYAVNLRQEVLRHDSDLEGPPRSVVAASLAVESGCPFKVVQGEAGRSVSWTDGG
jgi:hypothetical protein